MLNNYNNCGQITLFVGLEIHRLNHHKVMPVNLCICDTFFLPFLFLLLSLTLLELGPLNTVFHLVVEQKDSWLTWAKCY